MGKKKVFTNKKIRIVDGVKVHTLETEIASPYSVLAVEVGTTGKNYNKNTKNSRLYLKISDSLNSDISVIKDGSGKGFILRAKGDCEISTIIEALDFCSSQLKQQCSQQKPKQEKNLSPATLKQINLIKYLASQQSDISITKLPENSKDAGKIIDFLKNPASKIPHECKEYLAKEE